MSLAKNQLSLNLSLAQQKSTVNYYYNHHTHLYLTCFAHSLTFVFNAVPQQSATKKNKALIRQVWLTIYTLVHLADNFVNICYICQR